MPDIAALLNDLVCKRIDFPTCVATYPELTRDEQMRLLIAEQSVRKVDGQPCDLEHYEIILSWLSTEPESQLRVIENEFLLSLGRGAAPSEVVQEFETRYSRFGSLLRERLEAVVADWNTRALDSASFDDICMRFEDEIKEGKTPDIGEWLVKVPVASKRKFFKEALEILSEMLTKRSEPMPWDSYLERFPEYSDLISSEKERTPIHIGKKDKTDEGRNYRNETSRRPGELINNKYQLIRKLGEGTYGEVWQALQFGLNRFVAVKLQKDLSDEEGDGTVKFISEARRLAKLRHPGIVKVHEVDRHSDGRIYIVQEYIEGQHLDDWMGEMQTQANNPEYYRAIAKIIKKLAETLHYTWGEETLLHRDIKPKNILIEAKSGEPYLIDFGLSLTDVHINTDYGGSLAYKSPEQARGPGALIDGRSDLYSLGNVFYKMLTGRRPFDDKNQKELLKLIADVHRETVPASDLEPNIPPELNRICMRLLRKKKWERYQDGAELARDLDDWLEGKIKDRIQLQTKVIPHGLRSFSKEDAGSFMDLLAGPRTADGLPESIAFWLKGIEQKDNAHSFAIGLILGPSGCGKTSLMNAGLIPELLANITVVSVDATLDKTEKQLAGKIRKQFPRLSSELTLAESLEQVRKDRMGKLLLVIDQFEQWLAKPGDKSNSDLAMALRQCDGKNIQAILLVRDDFYTAVQRFLGELDIELDPQVNYRTVDLFESDHANKVLIKLGQGYNRLPDEDKSIKKEERDFVQAVVNGLMQDGRVSPVRLAIQAQMLRNKPWKKESLRDSGGESGIAKRIEFEFFEETFCSRHSDPRYRSHQESARRLLKGLIPVEDTRIRSEAKSREELKEISGSKRFGELMQILDSELRLITPSEPDADAAGTQEDQGPKYQLTHDFLVESLRDWLSSKQRETKQGQAELRLEELAKWWGAKQESRRLPTFREWLRILFRTKSRYWTDGERKMMGSANRYHFSRLLGLGLVGATALGGFAAYDAKRSIDELKVTDIDQLQKAPSLWRTLNPLRTQWIRSELAAPKTENPSEQDRDGRLNRLKLLLGLDRHTIEEVREIVDHLKGSNPDEASVVIKRLEAYAKNPRYSEFMLKNLWEEAQKKDPKTLLSVASALAKFDPESPLWQEISVPVADRLITEGERNPTEWGVWTGLLSSASEQLRKPLLEIALKVPGNVQDELRGDLAADLLNRVAADHFETLHGLVMQGRPKQFAAVFKNYETKHRSTAVGELREELGKPEPDREKNEKEEEREVRLSVIRRKANGAVALYRLREWDEVKDFLTVTDNPEKLSQFIHRLRGRDVDPGRMIETYQALAGELTDQLTPEERQQHYLRMYAFVLGLGDYPWKDLPVATREGLKTQMVNAYGEHPSRAVHSALGWTLRQWGFDAEVKAVDETEKPFDPSLEREWYVIKIDTPTDQWINNELGVPRFCKFDDVYLTMLVFPGGTFEMGESGNRNVTITQTTAISDREITWNQFNWIDCGTTWSEFVKRETNRNENLNYPATLSWQEMDLFCRELSRIQNNPDSGIRRFLANMDHDYVWNEFNEKSNKYWREMSRFDLNRPPYIWPRDLIPMRTQADPPGKPPEHKFRMPTEAEWEYIAGFGTITTTSIGDDLKILLDYVWGARNSLGKVQPTAVLKPNIAGLFDIYGNLMEMVQDDWTLEIKSGDFTDPCYPATQEDYMKDTLAKGGWYDALPKRFNSKDRIKSEAKDKKLNTHGFRVVTKH